MVLCLSSLSAVYSAVSAVCNGDQKMVKFKIVIGDSSGLTKQVEVDEPASKVFLNTRIGETVKGEVVDLVGYELQITGGSDIAGFPMRSDIALSGRKKVLVSNGVGVRKNPDKIRRRRTVAGGVVGPHIAQINVKVVKTGAQPLFSEEDKAKMAEKKAAKKATPETN
jgi:small subunit ribosomal protein S6e